MSVPPFLNTCILFILIEEKIVPRHIFQLLLKVNQYKFIYMMKIAFVKYTKIIYLPPINNVTRLILLKALHLINI